MRYQIIKEVILDVFKNGVWIDQIRRRPRGNKVFYKGKWFFFSGSVLYV